MVLNDTLESLKFSDTLSVMGYDELGNKKRGRPRGPRDSPATYVDKPIFSKVGVIIEGNKQLRDFALNNLIEKIVISGFRVSIILKDSTRVVIR